MITDDQVIDCYRLAKYYHVSPTVFLEMGITEVHTHLQRTIDLSHRIQRENSDE